jgi:membrane protease subunit HflC
MSNTKILIYMFGVICLFFIYSSFFTVDQTKQALVLQFGEPKRVVNKPGLNFKIHFSHVFNFFEKSV